MVIETYSDNTGTLKWQGTAMYASPDGTAWSNMPYTKEQKQWDKERKQDMIFCRAHNSILREKAKNIVL